MRLRAHGVHPGHLDDRARWVLEMAGVAPDWVEYYYATQEEDAGGVSLFFIFVWAIRMTSCFVHHRGWADASRDAEEYASGYERYERR